MSWTAKCHFFNFLKGQTSLLFQSWECELCQEWKKRLHMYTGTWLYPSYSFYVHYEFQTFSSASMCYDFFKLLLKFVLWTVSSFRRLMLQSKTFKLIFMEFIQSCRLIHYVLKLKLLFGAVCPILRKCWSRYPFCKPQSLTSNEFLELKWWQIITCEKLDRKLQ